MAQASPSGGATSLRLHRRVWRWHFLAGLLIVPFAVLLSASGAVYLFKPQFAQWQEARMQAGAPSQHASIELPMDALLEAAQSAQAGSTLVKITLPRGANDRSVEFDLRDPTGVVWTVWMDRYSGAPLHQARADQQLMAWTKRLHGSLLLGDRGSLVVELLASWMIVMLLTGLYLWWPRGTPWWRALFPRLTRQGGTRAFWRRLHGAVGLWFAGAILLLLLSGLPWTTVWGGGFDWVQRTMGWDGPGQEWVVTLQSGAQHAGHHGGADGLSLWERGSDNGNPVTLQSGPAAAAARPQSLQAIVDRVTPEQLPPPVELRPPRGDNGVWTVRSMTQNRPLRETVHFDQWTGAEIMRIRFADYHPVQRTVSYGIALHEGALFGWLNQFLALMTALAVIGLSASGGVVWWKRRPKGGLGIPPLPQNAGMSRGLTTFIIIGGLVLPLLGVSLLLLWLMDTMWTLARHGLRSGRSHATLP